MKITADTITANQIRELSRTALTASGHIACTDALVGRPRYTIVGRTIVLHTPTKRDRRNARAYCAEILNARSPSKEG